MKKVKVSFVMAVVTAPALFAFIHFSIIEVMFGEKALAKGLLFTLVAYGFTLISLISIRKNKLKACTNEMDLTRKYITVTGIACVLLSVLLSFFFNPNLDSMIFAPAIIFNIISFVNVLLLFKGLGGKTSGSFVSNPYHDQQGNLSSSGNDLVNPSSGMPMIGGVSGLDVQGNSFGNRHYE